MIQFSLIIPTLNESGNIADLLAQITSEAQSHDLHPEIIFVDDDSSDATREIILAYHGTLPVKLICRDQQKGLASAVIAGAAAAKFPFLVVMDADLSHPPAALHLLLQPLQDGSHDMVIGSRYVEGGKTPDWPLARRFGSQVASLPARLLTGVSDPLAGFFAIRRDCLIKPDTQLSGFKIGLEILARGNMPLRVLEIPIVFANRHFGASKMTSRVVGDYVQQLLSFCGIASPPSFFTLFALGLICGLVDLGFFTLLGDHVGLASRHCLSFLAALSVGFASLSFLRRSGFAQFSKLTSLSYQSFFLIVVFTLIGRGGLLAVSWLPPAPTITVSCLLAFLCGTTFAPQTLEGLRPKVRYRLFALLLISGIIVLRLIFLGSPELIEEEAYYWNYARHLDIGYLDHPPGIALLIWFGTLFFGNTELGVRLGPFLCWFATAFFTHRLSSAIFDRDVALRALLLVAVLPVFFGVAMFATPDAPLFAAWAASLFALHRAFSKGDWTSWLMVGLFLGFGLLAKYTIAFLGPAIVLFMLLDRHSRRLFFDPKPYLAALLALFLFSPVLLWNYQHNWASLLFQSQQRLADVFMFSTHKLLASILILITPLGALALFTSFRLFPNYSSPTGAAKSVLNRDRLFVLLMTGVPLLVFLVFSFTKEVKLNWTGPIWLAALPFMANAMTNEGDRLQILIRRLWPKMLVTCLICYGLFFHYAALGLPGFGYGSSIFLFGWRDLAKQLESTINYLEVRHGRRPIIVGTDRYQIASGLAFYRTNNGMTDSDVEHFVFTDETTGSHLFGHPSLMYSYWHPPAALAGRDMLVVARNKQLLDQSFFNNHYFRLGKIHEIQLVKFGKNVDLYYYRLLTWYKPNILVSMNKESAQLHMHAPNFHPPLLVSVGQ